MTTNERRSDLRRHLLGLSTAEERAAIELEYFENPDALDRVCEEEDDLIDDYLSGGLAPDEHHAFESRYLAAPHLRTRVAVSRRLRAAAAVLPQHTSPSSTQREHRFMTLMWPPAWVTSVAALILVAAGAVWMIRLGSAPPAANISSSSTTRSGQAADPAPPSTAPMVVALSISPTSVRGSSAPATLIIPPTPVVVLLRLQREGQEAPLKGGRAIVRTVAGNEVWRGPASAGDNRETLARIEILTRLEPEDYILELMDSDSAGRDVLRHQYFFRVRQ